MTGPIWMEDAVGAERLSAAFLAAARRRLYPVVQKPVEDEFEAEIRFVMSSLELALHTCLDADDEHRRAIAAKAFGLARTLPVPRDQPERAQWYLRVGILGVLGDRASDVHRLLVSEDVSFRDQAADWEKQVQATTHEVWLRLLRKDGWSDLDGVQHAVSRLRELQPEREPSFLSSVDGPEGKQTAWRLIWAYHQARAAELLGTYMSQGEVDGRFDIRQQLEAQLDRALAAAQNGRLIHEEITSRLVTAASMKMIESSIWTVTRSVNSRVTSFVKSLASRGRPRPIFEMLPPQRKTLREDGLLGSAYRSIVVSLPTSSGKTVIAQFRILQALGQFDRERGWIAYLAPTRALVNQVTARLRRDFADLDIIVERVSPALEVDGVEAELLIANDPGQQFRVLVTTPEKLDLMLRSGWEQKIARPLTLVVVDEAHSLASQTRGIRLELLLATINRECRHAQFLLLTPFIRNAEEIAKWLSPDSSKPVELGLDWSPNDRAVAIATPVRGERRGDFQVEFRTQPLHGTLNVPEALEFEETRPLGLSWSEAKGSQGRLAAATAQMLKYRGSVIVVAGRTDWAWSLAESLKVEENRASEVSANVRLVQEFLRAEMGDEFPLVELLEYGIGLHHSGLPDDVRMLMEWLTEHDELRFLVATTTIAHGVNFPVAGVVLATHQYPYGQDMPPEDFWNLAGRAGRIDQGDLGIIALAATDRAKEQQLEVFLGRAIGSLNSTLIQMVKGAMQEGRLLSLSQLSHEPEWSAFLQYLAHSYRLIGDHDEFAAEAEQVLRGTLGFQALRRSHPGWADQLLSGVHNYAERLRGKPLQLVDGTGFSWESVNATLARLAQERIDDNVWDEPLFVPGGRSLQRMMGVLLRVPELRGQLIEATGGDSPDGDKLARMIQDWVSGRTLLEMAQTHFGDTGVDELGRCCRSIFGRMTQTASWGLSALQALTLRDLDSLPEEQQRRLRNIPAKVFYGVKSDSAVLLRMNGVPRTAAEPLARELQVSDEDAIATARKRLKESQPQEWHNALGSHGTTYHRVWQILEGEAG